MQRLEPDALISRRPSCLGNSLAKRWRLRAANTRPTRGRCLCTLHLTSATSSLFVAGSSRNALCYRDDGIACQYSSISKESMLVVSARRARLADTARPQRQSQCRWGLASAKGSFIVVIANQLESPSYMSKNLELLWSTGQSNPSHRPAQGPGISLASKGRHGALFAVTQAAEQNMRGRKSLMACQAMRRVGGTEKSLGCLL